jgi:hypothetical protein
MGGLARITAPDGGGRTSVNWSLPAINSSYRLRFTLVVTVKLTPMLGMPGASGSVRLLNKSTADVVLSSSCWEHA